LEGLRARGRASRRLLAWPLRQDGGAIAAGAPPVGLLQGGPEKETDLAQNPSFLKRQKELARREWQQEKEARRKQRKLEKEERARQEEAKAVEASKPNG